MTDQKKGRTPPHALDAERGVLGSLLLDREAMLRVADILHADDFYDPRHVDIYAACADLFHAHTPIDLLTVSQRLADRDRLKKIGGRAYLAELTEEVPTSSHIFEYAQIVKKKSTLRKLLTAGQEITGLALDEDSDTNETLEKSEQSLFRVTQNLIKDKFVHVKEILNQRFEEFSEAKDAADEGRERDTGVPSGFHGIDEKLSGFKPADFVVLAARPSMGKTALALSIAQNIALKGGKSVGILSLEMSKEQLVDRMFASLMGVDSWKLHKGKLDENEWARIGNVMDEMSKASIFIDDSVGSSVLEVRAKARRLQMEYGLDMLVIDYLQLMNAGGNNWGGNRVQEISEISRSVKQLARELKIPIIALSQLSRAVEQRPDKRPQLSDLRESGAIEQDADVVLMLYRDDYYNDAGDIAAGTTPGLTEVFIRKNRNGPIGKVDLIFKKEQLRFFDIDKTHRDGTALPGAGAAMPAGAAAGFASFDDGF